MLKINNIKKDTMMKLFWRLHCRHQTQSITCTTAFNGNSEHETLVLVDSDTYVRRSARPADENENN